MIRCIIIEDQPPAQRVLQKYISDFGMIELKGTYADALQAMDFIKTEPIDLVFLDIHLPKISGIDFLKTLNPRPNVILTTAFSEYALESYDYNVLDYLLKPFSFERFVQAVSKMPSPKTLPKDSKEEVRSISFEEVIFIKSGYEHIKIAVSDIRFIQSDADYTEIVTTKKKYLTQEPLRYWEETLDPKKFIRVHKSYILNLSKIQKVVGNQVRLDEKTILPIGRAFKDGFMKLILK
ncbi:LytR/AlgR family response regulator transcription factor [Spongiimicrobium sp. 3-5]|uniref:LytR/AlgR family response regulator transcription factor n=1 Tax=Spongiimicrobium sp. 3-5 TaxID=3332596 RepID=UPI00397E9382